MGDFQLDPKLGILPLLPFYQPPEAQGQARELSPMPELPPPQPRLRLPEPAMAPQRYPVPQLSLQPGFNPIAGPPSTMATQDPTAAAAELQAQPPAPSPYRGARFSGNGFDLTLTPQDEEALVRGYQAMLKKRGSALGGLAGVNDDPSRAAGDLMASLSEFMDPEVAARLGIGVFQGEENRRSAEERAAAALAARQRRGSGSGGAPGTGALKPADIKGVLGDVRADKKLAALKQSERDLMEIVRMTNSPNAFEQRAAIGAKVKEISGAAATDKEREFYLGATGFWNSLDTKINSITEGGKVSPELMNQLRSHAVARLEAVRAEKEQAAQAARLRVDMIGADRDTLKRLIGSYVTDGAGGGGGGGSPDAEADELLE